MNLRIGIFAAVSATLLGAAAVQAAPTFHIAEGILPAGLGALQAERAAWAAAHGGPLMTEGFEGLGANPPNVFDFGDFTMTFVGDELTLYGSNSLVRTEGVQGLGFTNNGSVTFTFDDPISAFGIDWSSFDGGGTVIAYLDNAGGADPDIFLPVTRAGAGFFGVRNTDPFSSVTFTASSSEVLEFDYIQWSPIPEPGSLTLVGLAITCVAAMGRMKPNRRL